MQFLPDILQDIILFPKYYKPIINLSLNQKLYISFQFRNIHHINNELTSNINKYKKLKILL